MVSPQVQWVEISSLTMLANAPRGIDSATYRGATSVAVRSALNAGDVRMIPHHIGKLIWSVFLGIALFPVAVACPKSLRCFTDQSSVCQSLSANTLGHADEPLSSL